MAYINGNKVFTVNNTVYMGENLNVISSPQGVDTSTNILAKTSNQGVWVGSDTGYWYYWNGTQYVSGGTYISSVTPTSQTVYIGSNLPIYYEYQTSELLLYVHGNFNIVINNTITNVLKTTINNDYPTKTTLVNDVLSITLLVNESLVFNKTNNKIEIVSTVTNDMVVLIRNGMGQLLDGVLYYKIVNNELDNIYKKYVTQFYTTNTYVPVIEENPTVNNPCYFTFTGNMNIKVGVNSSATISTIASSVGTTLVTSPSGIENCIQINDSRSLVFNLITSNFELITRTDIKKYHINLLSCANGVVVGGLFTDVVNRIKNSYEEKMQIYITNGFYPYIESDLVNKKIYFAFYQVASRLSYTNDSTFSVSELATELGVNVVTSPEGHSNCIEIPNDYSLVFNIGNSKYRLVPRANVTFLDIVLIANVAGCNIKGVFISYKNEFVNNNDYNNRIPIKDKATELDTYINNSIENDLYLFFTDPHSQPKTIYYDKLLATISKYDKSIPFDFVLCGGDWLQNSDTPTEAKYRLGYISQSFKSNCIEYHQLLGNHDTNYQGTETLDNQTLVNVYNRKENSNYYSFKTNNTTYYCLDTGSDWVTTMDSYRWLQINWLANKLLNEDVKHSVIALHIYWNSGTTLSDMATNLNSLIVAYNTRTTVTLNSITYDFTNCTGHIEYVISGHTHADMNDKIGTIPVFSSLNATASGNISFDLVYVDYDNRILTLVRVGTGNNRQFDLDTGDII